MEKKNNHCTRILIMLNPNFVISSKFCNASLDPTCPFAVLMRPCLFLYAWLR